ncbi:MAG: hypothetical protein M1833_002332 [Piccolia ochrophora]|nr:MAG: hypothetical protein M1833_002332 [Piccolia ochrophora]
MSISSTPRPSPRPSISSLSLASPTLSNPSSPPLTPHSTSFSKPPPRRARAALRDYYGLQTAAAATASKDGAVNGNDTDYADGADDGGGPGGWGQGGAGVGRSELDEQGFDAEGYVRRVLEREGLEGVLRVEGGLVGDWWREDWADGFGGAEIRALDGERKALVYDNYSKLITATDTIRKMRTSLEPLTPATATLSPAIAHIAELSSSLSTSLSMPQGAPRSGDDASQVTAQVEKARLQRQGVRYVLDAPSRIRRLVSDGRREEAEAEWAKVTTLLDRWEGVSGVEEVRREGEGALQA